MKLRILGAELYIICGVMMAILVIGIFVTVEYRHATIASPVTELQHQIQNVTCVQSKFWICDVRINDTVILGYRSPVELQIGDRMWVIHKNGRTYLFGK